MKSSPHSRHEAGHSETLTDLSARALRQPNETPQFEAEVPGIRCLIDPENHGDGLQCPVMLERLPCSVSFSAQEHSGELEDRVAGDSKSPVG